MIFRLLLLLATLLPPLASGQNAAFPSPPPGQVLDSGNWLPDARRRHLESELGRIRLTHQVDVLVVVWEQGLRPGSSLEDLASRLGETWAREDLWAVVLHVPHSLAPPTLRAVRIGKLSFRSWSHCNAKVC